MSLSAEPHIQPLPFPMLDSFPPPGHLGGKDMGPSRNPGEWHFIHMRILPWKCGH